PVLNAQASTPFDMTRLPRKRPNFSCMLPSPPNKGLPAWSTTPGANSCRKPAWRPRVWPRIRGWASGPRAAHKPASTSTAFLQAKDPPDDEAVRADHVVIIRRFCASRGSRGIFAAANRSPPPLLLGFPLHRGAAQPVSPRAMSLLEVAAMRP